MGGEGMSVSCALAGKTAVEVVPLPVARSNFPRLYRHLCGVVSFSCRFSSSSSFDFLSRVLMLSAP